MDSVTVNIKKLRKLLVSGGMHIQAFLIRPDSRTVRFIQCITQAAITVVVYVPSDYTVNSDDRSITWEIDNIDIDSSPPAPEDLMDEYAENLQTNLDAVDTSEPALRQGYQVSVDLTEQPSEDLIELRDIVNQLDRLKHAVAGIPYGLAVAYKSYLLYLDSGGDVLGYRIEDFPHHSNTRRLYVVADLETVYSKMAVLASDSSKIYGSITGILTKNQKRLSRGLSNIIQTRGSALQMTETVNQRAQELRQEISRFGELYKRVGTAIADIETRIANVRDTTVHEDMAGSSQRYRLNKDLERAKGLRGRIADKLTELRELYEYLVLSTDKILFENILALERVLGNLQELQKITSISQNN